MRKILKSKIFWSIIIILVIAGSVFAYFFKGKAKTEYVTQEVKLGNIIQTVSATGKVKSASEIELNFKNAGKLSALNVKVGDQVKADQILAQLRASDLAINVSGASANLQEAIANLNKAQAGATKQDIAVYQAAVDKANTDLANAENDLANAKKTYSQALENEKQSALADANSALTKANISLQKIYDTLYFEGYRNNFISSRPNEESLVETQYDSALTKVDVAKLAYNSAKLNPELAGVNEVISKTSDALSMTADALSNLSSVLDYVITNSTLTQADLDILKTNINTEKTTINTSMATVQTAKHNLADADLAYQTEVDSAQNSVFVAEKNLVKAQADLEFKESPARPEDIALYEARVRRAQADLRLAQDKYDETILRAPINGVVTDVNFSIGEQTTLTQPVIKMLATENYEIEVDIPESDIAKISVGDKVEITYDAFTENDIFSGTITTINPAQTEIQDVVYYRVTVVSDQIQPENVAAIKEKIKPGMTANVTIKTAQMDNVLIIPLRAIKEENGKKIVQILKNEQPVSIEVEVGLRGDEGLVELKSGLQAGDLVITFIREKK